MNYNNVFKKIISNMVLPIFITMVILSVSIYFYTKNILLESYEKQDTLIYEHTLSIMELQDATLDIIEYEMKDEMLNITNLIIDTLEHANPYTLDLKTLNIDTNYDIYIINIDGFIINTTFEKDKNLNFFIFGEKHKQFLLEVFENDKFYDEPISIEYKTKKLKKYTYKSTKNKNFVVEIGTYSKNSDKIFDAIKKSMNKIKKNNQNIVSIDIFMDIENPYSVNTNNHLLNNHKEIIKDVYENKLNDKIIVKSNGHKYYYNYMYMDRGENNLYDGSVILIVIDMSYEITKLRNELYKYIIIFSVVTIFIIFLFYINLKILSNKLKKYSVE